MKSKNDKIAYLSEQLWKLKEEKKATTNALSSTPNYLELAQQKLEKAKINANWLSLLERKARFYPPKRRKIY